MKNILSNIFFHDCTFLWNIINKRKLVSKILEIRTSKKLKTKLLPPPLITLERVFTLCLIHKNN